MEKFRINLIILCSACFVLAYCGPHSHSKNHLTKERELDGAYSPRNENHYKDGEHNTEFDHEAILGSRGAAEEFDHLSPEESKKRLKMLSFKMDKDGDAKVDRKELVDWIQKSLRKLTEEEALEQMEDDDVNSDGKVSWDEYKSENYGFYNDNEIISEENVEEYQLLKNDEQLFKAADLNDDGFLDKSEFPGFSHPEEFEHMHEVLYEQNMKRRDKNNDGYLSFEEYMADSQGKAPLPGSEHYIVEKEQFQNDYDLDHDGRLDKQEVLHWLVPDNNEIAENEADHLIESSDENRDGKLSIEEIVDHHEIFVGSEATDFGEHLQHVHTFTDEL